MYCKIMAGSFAQMNRPIDRQMYSWTASSDMAKANRPVSHCQQTFKKADSELQDHQTYCLVIFASKDFNPLAVFLTTLFCGSQFLIIPK